MKRFLKDYRLHEHTEALFLLTLGIIIQVLDGSPLDVKSRWSMAWETEFPREYFSAFTQRIIKTVLSAIILVRCLTTVVYILFGVIVIYCIIKEKSPKLMLPWLFISGVKSVFLTFLETLTGVYVCSAFGKVRKPCIEFVISKAVELFFAIYLWACIRSIHKDLEQYEEDYRDEELLTKMVIHRVNLRLRRARSMIDETTLSKTAQLNYFELKDVPNIIFDMLKTEEELSQDSLLCPGMMLASVSNMGSYDYLKTSLSLGELGTLDLNSFQVVGLDDERNLTPSTRAMKFLKVTKDDIRKAREQMNSRTVYENKAILEDLSNLTDEPSSVFMRSTRPEEVFFANLPDLNNVKASLKKKKAHRKPHDDILCDSSEIEERNRANVEEFVAVDEEDGDEDEEELSYTASKDTDGDKSPDLWFMTNRKDEVMRLSMFETHYSRRSDNYERLYKQDFMSAIGSEVFDKASKLARLTSISDVNAEFSALRSMIYPSTSEIGEVETQPEVTEPEELMKPTRVKKKIAFEDHYDSHTTMPLSIIVTNFPLRFDSQISNCEGVYYRERRSSSSQIFLLPNRVEEQGLMDSDECTVADERNRGQVSERRKKKADELMGSKARTEYSSSMGGALHEVDVFALRCSRRGSDVMCGRRANELALSEDNEPNLTVKKSPDENSYIGASYPCPGLSEQMLFTKHLMQRPIKDVLKSYYNLRELDKHYSKNYTSTRRTFSNDSIPLSRGAVKKKIPWKTDPPENSPASNSPSLFREQSSITFSSLQARRQADGETQVHFGEDGLRSYVSTETIILGTPRTDRLQTDGNQLLPPLYLFGNRDQGWSTTPREVVGRSNQQCRVKSKSHTVTKSNANLGLGEIKGMIPGFPLPERSIVKENLAKTATSSDASFKLVLSPRQEPSQCIESYCSGRDDAVHTPRADDNQSMCSAESNESFSLFYSKTADLTSPLLDVSRFIYPDHIHYSYKNMKKKGFDVELNGELPLLMRDSLTLRPPMTVKRLDTPPDVETGIVRRPMDLTFANSDAFNLDSRIEPTTSTIRKEGSTTNASDDVTHPFRRHILRELTQKKEQKWMRKFTKEEKARNPDLEQGLELEDTSSTHLHSNKGRIVSNPLTILQNNKLRKQQRRVRLKNVAGSF